MSEVCSVIVGIPITGVTITGTISSGSQISGTIEPAYTIDPISEDFCNPASVKVIYFNGLAKFDGTFIFGGA